jgi:hypothetical protein
MRLATLTFVAGFFALSLLKAVAGRGTETAAPWASRTDSRVLGSGDALGDLISGTYDRKPSRKPVVKSANKKTFDTSKQTGVLKAAPPPRPVNPFAIWFGTQPAEVPELPPPTLIKPKLLTPKATVVASYRTVCVRLCDGAFFPVSSSTTSDKFERDEARCKHSCSSPAELYVYPVESGSAETMNDLEGRPYVRLTTAFKFRVAYDAACTCKPHPWDEASLERHRQYALKSQLKNSPDKRADASSRPQSLAAEFLAQSERRYPQSSRRFAAVSPDAGVFSDASDAGPLLTVEPLETYESVPPPPVITEPLNLPGNGEEGAPADAAETSDLDSAGPAVKPARPRRSRAWTGRSSLGRQAAKPIVSFRRRSTANDDFMLNFRR